MLNAVATVGHSLGWNEMPDVPTCISVVTAIRAGDLSTDVLAIFPTTAIDAAIRHQQSAIDSGSLTWASHAVGRNTGIGPSSTSGRIELRVGCAIERVRTYCNVREDGPTVGAAVSGKA